MPFKDRLRTARERTKPKVTQLQLAEALGVSDKAVSGWERGEFSPETDKIPLIANALRISVNDLFDPVPGGGGVDLTALQRPIVESFDPDAQDGNPQFSAVHADGAYNVPRDEIPQVRTHLGLGTSTDEPVINITTNNKTVLAAPIVGTWKLPASVVRRRLGTVSRIHIIECLGDSMEPTIKDGDFVFIDTARIVPSPPGIFALYDGFGQSLKRLELVPNTDPQRVLITSDNPKHQTFDRTLDEVNIIGRYVCRLTTS